MGDNMSRVVQPAYDQAASMLRPASAHASARPAQRRGVMKNIEQAMLAPMGPDHASVTWAAPDIQA
jgi:hypothetical protein